MKTRMITLALLFLAFIATAQNTADFEQRLYHSYVDDRIMDWKDIIPEMKSQYQKTKDKELLYSLCFAQYGYIGFCIGEDKTREAKRCLKDARANSKLLEKVYHGRHDILALQGALLGYQIILSKFSSLYLGPKAFKLINTASESSDKYFNCSLEYGNIRYFTPTFLGGSKKEAIAYYKNAVDILENSPKLEEQNWIYINTLLLLTNAYYETGSRNMACKYYKQILEYEPRANWIRDEMDTKCSD